MNLDRIRLILNSAFMLGAVASIILYFVVPDDPVPMFIVCATAIVLKFTEYIIRIFQNATHRNKRDPK